MSTYCDTSISSGRSSVEEERASASHDDFYTETGSNDSLTNSGTHTPSTVALRAQGSLSNLVLTSSGTPVLHRRHTVAALHLPPANREIIGATFLGLTPKGTAIAFRLKEVLSNLFRLLPKIDALPDKELTHDPLFDFRLIPLDKKNKNDKSKKASVMGNVLSLIQSAMDTHRFFFCDQSGRRLSIAALANQIALLVSASKIHISKNELEITNQRLRDVEAAAARHPDLVDWKSQETLNTLDIPSDIDPRSEDAICFYLLLHLHQQASVDAAPRLVNPLALAITHTLFFSTKTLFLNILKMLAMKEEGAPLCQQLRALSLCHTLVTLHGRKPFEEQTTAALKEIVNLTSHSKHLEIIQWGNEMSHQLSLLAEPDSGRHQVMTPKLSEGGTNFRYLLHEILKLKPADAEFKNVIHQLGADLKKLSIHHTMSIGLDELLNYSMIEHDPQSALQQTIKYFNQLTVFVVETVLSPARQYEENHFTAELREEALHDSAKIYLFFVEVAYWLMENHDFQSAFFIYCALDKAYLKHTRSTDKTDEMMGEMGRWFEFAPKTLTALWNHFLDRNNQETAMTLPLNVILFFRERFFRLPNLQGSMQGPHILPYHTINMAKIQRLGEIFIPLHEMRKLLKVELCSIKNAQPVYSNVQHLIQATLYEEGDVQIKQQEKEFILLAARIAQKDLRPAAFLGIV